MLSGGQAAGVQNVGDDAIYCRGWQGIGRESLRIEPPRRQSGHVERTGGMHSASLRNYALKLAGSVSRAKTPRSYRDWR